MSCVLLKRFGLHAIARRHENGLFCAHELVCGSGCALVCEIGCALVFENLLCDHELVCEIDCALACGYENGSTCAHWNGLFCPVNGRDDDENENATGCDDHENGFDDLDHVEILQHTGSQIQCVRN
jgi:hypothetical protein